MRIRSGIAEGSLSKKGSPAEPKATPVVEVQPVPPAEPVLASGGLTIDTSLERLLAIDDRHEVVRLAVDYAAILFDRTVLLGVRPGMLVAQESHGIDQKFIKTLMIPLAGPSVFSTVYQTGSMYRGVASPEIINENFLRAIGATPKTPVVLVPIVIKDKVVAILYGDTGEMDRLELLDVENLLKLGRGLADALSRIVLQAKFTELDPFLQHLQHKSTRDEIAEVVMEYAGKIFDVAAMLKIQGKVASGWKISRSAYAMKFSMLKLSLTQPSIVQTVVESATLYHGPMLATTMNRKLLEHLDGSEPKIALAIPFHVARRVVCVLYTHGGAADELSRGRYADLYRLMRVISGALEQCVLRLKKP